MANVLRCWARLWIVALYCGLAAASNGATVSLPDRTPLGGLGTGYVAIKPDGSIGAVTINNNRHQPLRSPGNFAAFYAESVQETFHAVLRDEPQPSRNWKRIETLRQAHPVVTTRYTHPSETLTVEQEAYTPFFLGDAERSATPAIVFCYTVRNQSEHEQTVSMAFSWSNMLGVGGVPEQRLALAGESVQQVVQRGDVYGLQYQFEPEEPIEPAQAQNTLGEYALLTQTQPKDRVSFLPAWDPQASVSEFHAMFAQGGRLIEGAGLKARVQVKGHVNDQHRPAAALAVQRSLPPNQQTTFVFVFSWRMPHQMADDGSDYGVYAATRWESAQRLAEETLASYHSIREEIAQIESQFLESSTPSWLLPSLQNSAALLAESSVFLRDGQFALFTGAPAYPGNLGSPEERLSQAQFLLTWFPDLLKRELQLYAREQLSTGEVPSAVGNLYSQFGSGDVLGGYQGRPDSTAAFVLLVYNYLKWTGDREFLEEIYPHLRQAMLWLMAQDRNNDSIPDGPSLLETQPHSVNLLTGSLWQAALRIGDEMLAEIELRNRARRIRQDVQPSLMSQLWNGQFFKPHYSASGAENQPATLALGRLGGEAFAQLHGFHSLLDSEALQTHYQTLAENLPAANSPSDHPSTIQASLALAFEITSLTRVGYLSSVENYFHGLTPPMRNTTDAAAWWLFHALTGFRIDHSRQSLIVGPQILNQRDALDMPIIHSDYSGRMQVFHDPATPTVECVLTFDQSVERHKTQLQQVAYNPPSFALAETLVLRVLHNGEYVIGQDFTREKKRIYDFDRPLTLKAGDRLTLVAASEHPGKIRIDLDNYSVNKLGAHSQIETLGMSAPSYSLMITNTLRQLQLIHLEFMQQSSTQYGIYLDGRKLPPLGNRTEAFPLLLQTSPIRRQQAQWLKQVKTASADAIRKAANTPNNEDLLNRLWELQGAVENSIEMDQSLRGVRLDVIASGLAEEPQPRESDIEPQDLIKQIEQAHKLEAQFLQNLHRTISDPVTASEIRGYFTPLEVDLQKERISRETASFTITLTIRNPQHVAHDSRIALDLPEGWTYETQDSVSFTSENTPARIHFTVTPAVDLWQRRVNLTAVIAGAWQGQPYRKLIPFSVGHNFAKRWMVIGPFSRRGGEGFEQKYPPEMNIKPEETYAGLNQQVQWQPYTFEDGFVDLNQMLSAQSGAIGYAYTAIYSPREQPVRLNVGAFGDLKIFHNYKEIYARRNLQNPAPGSYSQPVKFMKGWNHILVKCGERSGQWGFYMEITDLQGQSLPGLEYSLEKAI